MPKIPGNHQFEKGKHTVTIQLNAAAYAALKLATQIQCGPREPGDQIGHAEMRRFIRIAVHSVAMAAIRAGAVSSSTLAVDLREETDQEYRERIHLVLNPQDVAKAWFGCPPSAHTILSGQPETETDPADFWKGFHRGN